MLQPASTEFPNDAHGYRHFDPRDQSVRKQREAPLISKQTRALAIANSFQLQINTHRIDHKQSDDSTEAMYIRGRSKTEDRTTKTTGWAEDETSLQETRTGLCDTSKTNQDKNQSHEDTVRSPRVGKQSQIVQYQKNSKSPERRK